MSTATREADLFSSAADAGRGARRRRARQAAALTLLFLAALAFAWSFRGRYVDDAYISMQYARNLVENGTWGLLPGRISNTATSPLGVLTLALVGLLTRSLVDAVVWLTALELTLLGVVLASLSRRLFGNVALALVALPALAFNPLLLSTWGLESMLFVLLSVTAVLAAATHRGWALGVVGGLLVLTRPDGAVLFGVLLVLGGGGWRWRRTAILAAAAVPLPWLMFSWLVLGSFVPDTLLIKTGEAAWGTTTFTTGAALFFEVFPLAVGLSVAPAVFALGCLRPRLPAQARRVALAFAAFGAVHFAAYSLLGVPPYHWYYTPQVLSLVMLGAVGAAGASVARWRAAGASVAVVAALVPAAGLGALADVRGFPFEEPLISTNWATPARYRDIGLQLQALVPADARVDLWGEVGTLAFYSERTLVNEFTDRNAATEMLLANEDLAVPVVGRVLRVGLRYRKPLPDLPEPSYLIAHVPYDDGAGLSDPNLVHVWETSTRWTPFARMYLYRLPPKPE